MNKTDVSRIVEEYFKKKQAPYFADCKSDNGNNIIQAYIDYPLFSSFIYSDVSLLLRIDVKISELSHNTENTDSLLKVCVYYPVMIEKIRDLEDLVIKYNRRLRYRNTGDIVKIVYDPSSGLLYASLEIENTYNSPSVGRFYVEKAINIAIESIINAFADIEEAINNHVHGGVNRSRRNSFCESAVHKSNIQSTSEEDKMGRMKALFDEFNKQIANNAFSDFEDDFWDEP